ncbi:hypothetical protein [Burkholderia ambifaria]|uniref:hypothetical protein n=1 Tax=Burkholderia ambifaria TaxID=152480 RepID=UPI001FC8781C|nr:hypothetical protein [Burkholderia ambifaria]
MNKTLTDQQIEAAKEAGFYWHPIRKRLVVRHSSGAWVAVDEMLAHLATLLAAQQPEPIAHLTDDHRGKIERAEEQLRGRGPKDVEAANGLLDVLTAHAVQPEPRAEVTDTDRLDLLIKQQAWIQWTVRDGSIRQCQVYDQDEDENYHILSGKDRYFNTPREAIDAALAGEGQ